MGKVNKIPCMIIRSGTSKGVFFLEKDIPESGEKRDQCLLRVMGSPDRKQIDGLGGGTSVTSKVAIVSPSEREDADVDYTFAQVSVDKPIVSYKGNCGNISSGVGPFAIEHGLVEIKEPITTVRIYNTNTDKIIAEEVMVEDGAVKYDGTFAIAGVPGTGAPIKLKFLNPAGTISDKLLPTGNAVDLLEVPEVGQIPASIVDAANPLVFVKASDLGMNGTELPEEIDLDSELLDRIERVRGVAAVTLGLAKSYDMASWESPTIPKMTIVAAAQDYKTVSGEVLEQKQVDLLSRMMSMQKTHPTYAMTGAMCTAAAAVVPGSIVNQMIGSEANTEFLRIGHPGGVLEAGVEYADRAGEVEINCTFGFRTANLLLEGRVVV